MVVWLKDEPQNDLFSAFLWGVIYAEMILCWNGFCNVSTIWKQKQTQKTFINIPSKVAVL